jgi:hypothetical protein
VPSNSDLAAKLDDANGKLTISIGLAAIAIVVAGASLALGLRRR